MKIVVFGATGLTGGLAVQRALATEHDVVALIRDAKKLKIQHERLEVRQGSPVSTSDVEACVIGADAVIHCLGIGGKGDGQQTMLISDSVKLVLAAMEKHGVRRIVCMSNVGAGGSGTWFANRIVIPLFIRWLLPIIEDKNRMEQALRDSQVEWVSVRIPQIVEGPMLPVRVSADGRGIGLKITAESVADFLLAQATADKYIRSTLSISN
jgi:uncharacterized protein YbjT (DUF2867 family)